MKNKFRAQGSLLPGIISSIIPEMAFAKCKFDPESGVFYDSPALVIILAIALMGVLFRTLLKEWSDEHPYIATALFLGVPVLAGVVGSGDC